MSASSDPTAALDLTAEVVERSVVLPKHLHARPAGQIAQVAARNRGTTIELIFGEKRANARSVLAVMGMGAVHGTEVGVVVSGPGAQEVADEVALILSTPEDE
jgi:phosphocarrier protein HPr